jgi:hypothetical protein
MKVEQAMRQYIASYTVITHAQNTKPSMLHIEKASPNPKIYSFKQDIFKWLVNSQPYTEVPQFILRKHLENAIAALSGTDKRTINKWRNDLEKNGCIKKSGVQQYESSSLSV